MDITREEYRLLKQFYKRGIIGIDNDISRILLKKKLIEHKGYTMNRDGSVVFSYEFVITNSGKIAYENYHDKIVSVRRANIQSWIAITISICSLAVSLISLLQG